MSKVGVHFVAQVNGCALQHDFDEVVGFAFAVEDSFDVGCNKRCFINCMWIEKNEMLSNIQIRAGSILTEIEESTILNNFIRIEIRKRLKF